MKTALITGGNSGIGYELAKLFAEDGYRLILVARDKAKLQNAAKELNKNYSATVDYIVLDLADPASTDKLFKKTEEMGLKVTALVNNAGFGDYSELVKADWNKLRDMIQVNVMCLTHLSKLYSPSMVEQRSGYVLNIASTAAFFPGPLMATYYASKAYVLSFSVAIANELKPFGIQVSALCPGPTSTQFGKSAKVDDSPLFKKQLLSASSVAKAGYDGLMNSKDVIIPKFSNKIAIALGRLAPLSEAAKITRAMQEK